MKITSLTTSYRAMLISKSLKPWVKLGTKCLDIGCGNGVVSLYLQKSLKISITGCDVLEYLNTNLPFKMMTSLNRIPFPNGSFDIALLNDVLHHMSYKNQTEILKESFRVAKKVIIFEEEPTLIGKICDYVLNKIHNPQMDIPLSFRTSSQWLQLFNKLGCKVISQRIQADFWYPFSHVAFLVTPDNIGNRNNGKPIK